LPPQVRERVIAAHLSGVFHAEAFDGGWLLARDAGEFGGGLSWLPAAGDTALEFDLTAAGDDEHHPQNVRHVQRDGDAVYVLQGLAHMGISEGQLTKVWRHGTRFTARVLAHYRSAPIDWLRSPEGAWLVWTTNAVWQTDEAGVSELVTRLPDDVVWDPGALVRMPDGVLLLGSTEGVLRMTPLWPDAPRYAAELLIPQARHDHRCRGINVQYLPDGGESP
jgi:hypothetical protein